ncbi:HlyD family efflux transporter periplasmic adaptor subunit [Synechococcus sp. WH 5701]|uniref:HlyD family efflux transporter periplasmic adaptor subunit n=1 Tax=Synechococcus sp. WH 5701 TaxID=69042 RepID=UPI000A0170C9|nr:HlyD family efflux transporter periplasmic adaptor subunit [Synechococcus sp. WH 5701]
MSTPKSSFSLVEFYDKVLSRLRSPRRRAESKHEVIPVRVDLVGEAAETNPFLPTNGALTANGGGPDPGTLAPKAADWEFNQPVMLGRSHRASGLIAWTLVSSIGIVVVWAAVAPLSVAVAVQGKLQPGSKVKLVQAPVPGVIDALLVKEGETVRKGQSLVRFDLREVTSKLAAAEAIRTRLRNENQILAASLGDRPATGLTANQQLQLENRSVDLSSRRQIAEQELRANQARIDGLRTSLATAENILGRFDSLARSGAVSELQLLEARSRVNDLNASLAVELETSAKLRAGVANSVASPGADLRSQVEANLRQIADLTQQIDVARVQLQYSVLTAPSDGAVFDIDVAPGSVVNTTTPLLKVVPADALEAKVFIPNTAIGYLRPGQRADISLDTYPSNDYGRIPAKVLSIGSDALTTEEMAQTLQSNTQGLFFPAILQLERQSLRVGSRDVPLKPGMSLVADVQLRERTFLSVIASFLNDKRRSLERLN